MKDKLINKNKKGFTLVELLLVLALLSIIVTVVFNFQIFNLKVYSKSDNLSQVQFDVRMASDYITTSVRNASSISTTDSSLANFIDGDILRDKYRFVNTVEFEIDSQEGYYFLKYILYGSDSNGKSPYELKSEVFLDNITSAIRASSEIIYYTK